MGPGRKDDDGKNRLDLIPPEAILAIGEVMSHGAKVYSPNNWQKVENFNNRYYAAALRHLLTWRDGEDVDKESNLHHLKHALCNLTFLVWGIDNETK